jgi:hypothetical protein
MSGVGLAGPGRRDPRVPAPLSGLRLRDVRLLRRSFLRVQGVNVAAAETEERAALGQRDAGALATLGAGLELVAAKPVVHVHVAHRPLKGRTSCAENPCKFNRPNGLLAGVGAGCAAGPLRTDYDVKSMPLTQLSAPSLDGVPLSSGMTVKLLNFAAG